MAQPENHQRKKDWQLRNAVKRKAHIQVGNALRDGLMKKPANCSLCLALAKVEGHHDDYARPLDVRWLCVSCHKRVHKEMRNKHGTIERSNEGLQAGR